MDATRPGVKKGIPGLPVPRSPKGQECVAMVATRPVVKKGIPGLPVPRSPKGRECVAMVATRPGVKEGIPGLPVPRSPKLGSDHSLVIYLLQGSCQFSVLMSQCSAGLDLRGSERMKNFQSRVFGSRCAQAARLAAVHRIGSVHKSGDFLNSLVSLREPLAEPLGPSLLRKSASPASRASSVL